MIGRRCLAILAALFSAAVPSPASAAADGDDDMIRPVAAYAGKFLLGKLAVDPIWDLVTGKPDVALLERRLRELENNAAMRSEMREEIRKLRESVNNRVTREEFRRMAEQTKAEIGAIQRRLDDLEERVEKLEVADEDRKNETRNGMDARFFLRRGEQYEGRKQIYKALACYNIAIGLAPADAALYRKRCGYYVALGAPGVGIPDATEAIRLDPNDAAAYRYRGIGESHEQDYDAAIADFAQASRIDPSYSDPTYNHARAVVRICRVHPFLIDNDENGSEKRLRSSPIALEGALTDLNAAIQLDPSYAEAYYRRGRVYREKKDVQNSLSDFNAAIRLDPGHPLAYLFRGDAYHDIKEYDKAIEDITEAIRLDPKDRGDWFLRTAYVLRGGAYSGKGDRARSNADFAEARRVVAEIRARSQ